MKKNVLLVAAVVVATFTVNAQDDMSSDFKPVAGEKTIEVDFAPFGGNPISSSGLKFRSFTSETTALRLGINIAYERNNGPVSEDSLDTNSDGVNDMGEKLVDYDTEFGVNIEPGYEMHFAGTNRLSPYIGGVATIGYNRSTNVDEQLGDVDLTNNDPTPTLDAGVYKSKTINSGLNLGIRLVLGADWYFTQKMYLGFEVGYGVLYTKNFDEKVRMSDIELTSDQEEALEDADVAKGNDIQVGAIVNSAIRLGFAF